MKQEATLQNLNSESKPILSAGGAAAGRRAYYFTPERPLGEAITDETIRYLLKQDPRLEYQVESDQMYVISGGNELSIIVPKDRNLPDVYSPREVTTIRAIFRLLGWAFLGLAPAGLGALVLGPVAAMRALRLYFSQPLSQSDRTRLAIALMIDGGIMATGLVLQLLYLWRVLS